MGRESAGCLQGALDLLVLRTLDSQGRMHGYGITVHIQSRSENALRIEEGSLYPALHRMEQSGWLTSSWGESETNRRAKFYAITKAGRKQLDAETERWERISLAMTAALRTT